MNFSNNYPPSKDIKEEKLKYMNQIMKETHKIFKNNMEIVYFYIDLEKNRTKLKSKDLRKLYKILEEKKAIRQSFTSIKQTIESLIFQSQEELLCLKRIFFRTIEKINSKFSVLQLLNRVMNKEFKSCVIKLSKCTAKLLKEFENSNNLTCIIQVFLAIFQQNKWMQSQIYEQIIDQNYVSSIQQFNQIFSHQGYMLKIQAKEEATDSQTESKDNDLYDASQQFKRRPRRKLSKFKFGRYLSLENQELEEQQKISNPLQIIIPLVKFISSASSKYITDAAQFQSQKSIKSENSNPSERSSNNSEKQIKETNTQENCEATAHNSRVCDQQFEEKQESTTQKMGQDSQQSQFLEKFIENRENSPKMQRKRTHKMSIFCTPSNNKNDWRQLKNRFSEAKTSKFEQTFQLLKIKQKKLCQNISKNPSISRNEQRNSKIKDNKSNEFDGKQKQNRDPNKNTQINRILEIYQQNYAIKLINLDKQISLDLLNSNIRENNNSESKTIIKGVSGSSNRISHESKPKMAKISLRIQKDRTTFGACSLSSTIYPNQLCPTSSQKKTRQQKKHNHASQKFSHQKFLLSSLNIVSSPKKTNFMTPQALSQLLNSLPTDHSDTPKKSVKGNTDRSQKSSLQFNRQRYRVYARNKRSIV